MAKHILGGEEMARALQRITYEVLERNRGLSDVVLIGIQRRGVVLAKRMADIVLKTEGISVPVGILDITLYRDDLSLLSEHPVINGTDIAFSVNGKRIVLVDDVIYTGRTVRSAIEVIMDMGRPANIQLAVLIDRGGRELPISADYIGKTVPAAKNEIIDVMVGEIDGEENVCITMKNQKREIDFD